MSEQLDLNQKVAKLQQFTCKLSVQQQSFAVSLVGQFSKKGELSEKQLPFIDKLLNEIKVILNPAAAPERPKVANFSRIVGVFDHAKEKGYKKKIKLRFGDNTYKVALSEAPSYGNNAGMIYVTLNEEYKGKISREGVFQASGKQDDKLLQMVSEFSIDPLTVAKKYGFATKNCCCCGKVLTDPVSIANGIGPICESKFF